MFTRIVKEKDEFYVITKRFSASAISKEFGYNDFDVFKKILRDKFNCLVDPDSLISYSSLEDAEPIKEWFESLELINKLNQKI